MNESSPVLIEHSDGIMRITLNRPDAANAIDLPTARALMNAAIEADLDPAVRVVVLTGAGRFFCAGGDVRAFAAGGERLPHVIKELAGYLHIAISRFARMNKPLLTAINGPVAGAGVGLSLLGDITIAARSAHFTLAYSAIGLSPDGGATWLLPRLIGLRRAQELAITNKRTSADEAAAMGMITRAVDDASFAADIDATAAQLQSSATASLGRIRELLLSSYGASLEAHLEQEARGIAAAASSAAGREGISAFLAKRPANFKDS